MKPFLLNAPCKDYLWGGQRLRDFGKSGGERIAESWELSCHPDGESRIGSGECAGMPLRALWEEHPELLGERCKACGRFPILIKLIDAAEALSVQVHPDDAYALAHENDFGKTEAWYIVEAAPGAEILLGLRETMTPEAFRTAAEDGSILQKLLHIPVKRGDVFRIPAGTVHALGKGILAAEVQQSSNVTYRVYDYGRGRELHLEKALAVADLQAAEPIAQPLRRPGVSTRYLTEVSGFGMLEYRIRRSAHIRVTEESFLHLLITEGSGELKHPEVSLRLERGTSVFLPAGCGGCEIAGNCTALVTGKQVNLR